MHGLSDRCGIALSLRHPLICPLLTGDYQTGKKRLAMTFDDDHPIWDNFSGGDGHRGHADWSATDGPRAAAFYEAMDDRARSFLDLLIDRPGELLDAGWIADEMFGSDPAADKTGRRRRVARSIRGMSAAHTTSGLRYPFKWFKGRNGAATQYGMRPHVAALFRAARR